MARKFPIWVVVADGAHAKIFASAGVGQKLETVLDREIEAARGRTSDIVTDKRGRHGDPDHAGHHAMDPRESPKRHVEESFARDIAHSLGRAATDKAFKSLVLVAPPRTLGDLRASLPASAEALVVEEIDKDLVRLSTHQLAERLSDVLGPPPARLA